MTGHAFRALASTKLNEMGYRPDVLQRQLYVLSVNLHILKRTMFGPPSIAASASKSVKR
jgi:hypothetical protein